MFFNLFKKSEKPDAEKAVETTPQEPAVVQPEVAATEPEVTSESRTEPLAVPESPVVA